MLAMMAPLAYNLAKHIPIARLRPYFDSHRELADIASIAVKNSRSDATERNVFSNILAQAGNGTLTDRQVTIEAGNLISAGSDTTAETLTYLIWAVLSRLDIQSQLEEEVANIDDSMLDSELEKAAYPQRCHSGDNEAESCFTISSAESGAESRREAPRVLFA